MTANETRQRIVDAALATLKQEGITGTSARAIARTGGFNQALIFYHYGGVHEVLLAGIDQLSGQRLQRYGDRLAEVRTLPELVEVAAELHREDVEEGHLTVLAQMVAGSWGSPERGAALARRSTRGSKSSSRPSRPSSTAPRTRPSSRRATWRSQ